LREGDAPGKNNLSYLVEEMGTCQEREENGRSKKRRWKWEKQEKHEVKRRKARKKGWKSAYIYLQKSRKGKCVYISPVLHGFKIFPSCSSSSSIN